MKLSRTLGARRCARGMAGRSIAEYGSRTQHPPVSARAIFHRKLLRALTMSDGPTDRPCAPSIRACCSPPGRRVLWVEGIQGDISATPCETNSSSVSRTTGIILARKPTPDPRILILMKLFGDVEHARERDEKFFFSRGNSH